MSRLKYPRYLELIRGDAERLAGQATALDAKVPPCPGWDVREAVRHTGSVFRHKVACLRLNRAPVEGEWVKEPQPHEGPVPWFRESLELLLDELSSRQPEDPAYTWWPPEQNAGFWARRMALETVVHRADVESASGAMTSVDPGLAVDGIDEVLQIFLAGRGATAGGADGRGRVAVTADDESWTVRLEPDGVTVEAAPSAATDAQLTGDPSALFLYLWGRAPVEALSRAGDTSLVDSLRNRLAIATQ
jgi:uncharacterized protein (TIGR03083 family)